MFNSIQKNTFCEILDQHSTPMQVTINSDYDGCLNFIIDERGCQRTRYEIDDAGKITVLEEKPPPSQAIN